MFESIVGYQLFIVLSLVGCRIFFPNALGLLALFWTALSLINLFWFPLLVLQLVVVWVAHGMLARGSAYNSLVKPDVPEGSPPDASPSTTPSKDSKPASVILTARPSTASMFNLILRSSDVIGVAVGVSSVAEIREARGITDLTHFTRAENLRSIVADGLLSVADMERKKQIFLRNDAQRLDGHFDAISLSVSFPNYRMLFKYRQEQSTSDWVVLLLDPALLDTVDCKFCALNASDHRIRSRSRADLAGPDAFSAMFATRDGQYRNDSLRDCDPTDPQAEALVFGHIAPRFIKRVVFQNLFARDCYADVTYGIPTEVEPAYFMPRDVALTRERFRGPTPRIRA